MAKGKGEKVEHDLSDLTGGGIETVYQLRWDKKKDRVVYKLLKPVRVNIRVVKDKMLLATLVNWLPGGYGEHYISWDGHDSSGVYDLKKAKNVTLYAEAYALSGNTVLVAGDTNQVAFVEVSERNKKIRKRKKSRRLDMKDHSQHNLQSAGDFKVNVVLPGDLKKSKSGGTVVNGIVPVRFELDKKDIQRIVNERFDAILFVDGEYFSENSMGFFPATWNIDTALLEPGEHILTVNLLGYNRHFGAASARIVVQ